MNKIYVFSSTGTSLQVAKDITKHLDSYEIVSIPKLMRQKDWSIEADNAGFIFPCYYGEAPQLISRFIKEARSVTIKYSFAVATAGGNIGYSLKMLNDLLKERGCLLHYGKEIIIASNYMTGWYYDMIMPSKNKLAKRVALAEKKCQSIADDVGHQVTAGFTKNLIGYTMPHLISPARYIKDTRSWDSEFSIDATCNGCKTCESVCPVKNITIENKRPVFNNNCQRCMACIQYCPKSAFIVQGKAMNKDKYMHPKVAKKEMITFNS